MEQKIIVVDYGMGNLHSVIKALKRIGVNAIISSNPEELENADKIILPGVGHFKKAIENLKDEGFIEILNKKVLEDKTPILGICLGMQLFSKFSEEGDVEGLGWIDAETKKLKINETNLKIPHMGWNSVEIKKESKLLNGIENDELFYFVHSYNVVCSNSKDILTKTKYGAEFNSAVEKENIFGTQFHPEKSHKAGLKILKNFIENV